MSTAHRSIRRANPQPTVEDDPLEAARAELHEAREHAERLRQLVAEGKADASALHVADYKVSAAGKAIAQLLASQAPPPPDAA